MINSKFRIVIVSDKKRERGVYTSHVDTCKFYFINIVVDNDCSLSFVHFCCTQIINN